MIPRQQKLMVLHKKITTRTTIILRVVVQCLTGRIAGCQVGSSNPSQWNLKNGISCQTNLARVKGVVQLHRHKITDETFDRSCQNCFNTKFTKLQSRPAPGRDFTCCGGIPQFTRGKGHGRATQH